MNAQEFFKAEFYKGFTFEGDFVDKLIADTVFPKKLRIFTDSTPPRFSPIREGRNEKIHARELFIQKIGRSVGVESASELRVFSKLDRSGKIWWFCEQPLFINYFFSNQKRRYTPDVLIVTTDRRAIIIEVKDGIQMVAAYNLIRYRAAIDYARTVGYGYVVITPRGLTINDLFFVDVPYEVEDGFLSLLDMQGFLTFDQIKTFSLKTRLSAIQLMGIVVRNGLKLKLDPFTITRGLETINFDCLLKT